MDASVGIVSELQLQLYAASFWGQGDKVESLLARGALSNMANRITGAINFPLLFPCLFAPLNPYPQLFTKGGRLFMRLPSKSMVP